LLARAAVYAPTAKPWKGLGPGVLESRAAVAGGRDGVAPPRTRAHARLVDLCLIRGRDADHVAAPFDESMQRHDRRGRHESPPGRGGADGLTIELARVDVDLDGASAERVRRDDQRRSLEAHRIAALLNGHLRPVLQKARDARSPARTSM
jgi:hypothetical protein